MSAPWVTPRAALMERKCKVVWLETMELTIDGRERGLIRIFVGAGVAHKVETLPVGDVVCRYENGRAWIAERKRSDDLAASLKDGRWREQSVRLFGSGHQVVYLLEGDFRDAGVLYPNLLGAWMNSELRRNCCVFRTIDLEETALVLRGLMAKLEHAPSYAAPTNGLAAPQLSKRKRNEDDNVVFLRVLMCVPSISEAVARKLAEHFGNLAQLQEALRSSKFPTIQLSGKTALGKARIAKLSKYLL